MPFRWHPDEDPPQIESHSKAKLSVLRSYLRAYFDRLNVNPGRTEFKLDLVDGFAGGGTFLSNDEIVSGSPLIMLEETERASERLNQDRHHPLNFDCKYYFVDVERAHMDHLRKVLNERGHPLDDDTIVLRNNAFEEEADSIISEISRRQPRAGRAIFLLDQTGFSQVELGLVARILHELPGAELILTFAADALVNHLANTPQLLQSVRPLELTDSHVRTLIEQRDGSGGRALVQRTLRDRIRNVTGAKFDTPFFIRPRQSRRALWFLHLSRHPTARDVMIQCHWDNRNTFEHYGTGDFGMMGWDALDSEEPPLFNFNEHDARTMREQLLQSMPRELFGLVSEKPDTVKAMRLALANETAARFSDLDDVVLQLFREGEIRILRPDGKPRSRALQRLRRDDQIALPDTLFLPGISRFHKE